MFIFFNKKRTNSAEEMKRKIAIFHQINEKTDELALFVL